MTTLYLAWQDADSRRWFPVGQLVAYNGNGIAAAGAAATDVMYEFAYITGAQDAQKAAGFPPIPGFPDLTRQYRSIRLFPLFQNRVMNQGRPDRADYLRRLGLAEDTDAMSELAASGGPRRTDTYRVFPAIVPSADDGRFTYRCPLHGLRDIVADAIKHTETLQPGDALNLVSDSDNPAALSVKVKTGNGHHIGWLPRYLVDDLQHDGDWLVEDARATVAQVNLDGPLSHRLLIDFSGKLPPGFRMEDLPQYRPIAAPAD